MRPTCVLLGALVAPALLAQQLMVDSEGNPSTLLQSDQAVLDDQYRPQNLSCDVVPIRAFLGYDLRFHTGYSVNCFGEALENGQLAIVFRVRPKNHSGTYLFFQRIKLPSPEPPKNVSALGAIDIGVGEYTVDWMIRDALGRSKAQTWEVRTGNAASDHALLLPPWNVSQGGSLYKGGDPRSKNAQMHVLVDFSPVNDGSGTLRELDKAALYSMMQAVMESTRPEGLRITVFQLSTQKIIFEHKSGELDLNRLIDSVEHNAGGGVLYGALTGESPAGTFAANLLARTQSGEDSPVPVVWIGPAPEEFAGDESLAPLAARSFPLAYLTYVPNPGLVRWNDPVLKITKKLKGRQFLVRQPGDLLGGWDSLREFIHR